MSTYANPSPTVTPLDGTFVLHNRQLRPGTILADTARFEDSDWPLAPAALQGQERGLTLRFDKVPARHRQALKLLAYAFLSRELPADEPRPSISSVASVFYNAAVFLRWLDSHHSVRSLAHVTDETLLQFQRFLLGRYRSPSRRRMLRAAVVFFGGIDEAFPMRHSRWIHAQSLAGTNSKTRHNSVPKTPRLGYPRTSTAGC